MSKKIDSPKKGQLLTAVSALAFCYTEPCLILGTIMRPVTDEAKISRAKLSYLIDATAAPICMIAPISSWAAAVAGFAEGSGMNGLELFIRAIPYNFYAILTIVMMFAMVFMRFEYGEMSKYEKAVQFMDSVVSEEEENSKGKVIDLVMPIILLIVFCIIGMIYTGGFFDKEAANHLNIVSSFADCDASVGLVLGSFAAFILTIIFYLCRRIISFKEYYIVARLRSGGFQ